MQQQGDKPPTGTIHRYTPMHHPFTASAVPLYATTCCRNAQSLAFDALRLAALLAYEVLAVTRESAPAALAEAAQLLHTHALLVRTFAA
jgi:hypothetical protein